jgi:hypothetical protein
MPSTSSLRARQLAASLAPHAPASHGIDTASQEVDELFRHLAIDVTATPPPESTTPADDSSNCGATPSGHRPTALKLHTPRRQRGSAASPSARGSSSRSTSARRKRFVSNHPLSDSDASASEGDDDHLVLFRALRMDEVCDASVAAVDGVPRLAKGGGICAPENAIVKPPGAHVQAGSRARLPSTWVSFTKSRKVASIWAAASAAAAKRPAGFIAMVRVPRAHAALDGDSPTGTMSFVCRDGTTATCPNVVDLAGSSQLGREVAPMAREDVHGLGVLGARAAASSKEVLVGTMVPGGVVVAASSVVAVGRVTVGSHDTPLPLPKPPMMTVSVHRGRARVKDQPLEAVLELHRCSPTAAAEPAAAMVPPLPQGRGSTRGSAMIEGLIAAVGKLRLW